MYSHFLFLSHCYSMFQSKHAFHNFFNLIVIISNFNVTIIFKLTKDKHTTYPKDALVCFFLSSVFICVSVILVELIFYICALHFSF